MSLTEVMLGGAILAGVGLAGATLMKNQKKAQQRVDMDQRLARFHATLSKTLIQTQHCNATLRNFYNQPISASATQGIYQCQTNCTIEDLESDANSVTRSTELFTNTSERYIDDTRTWRIANVSIPVGRTTTGALNLRIDYMMNPSLGTQRVSRMIPLNVRFNGGVFRECYDPQESSVNNLQNDLCKTASAIDSTGVIARWNPTTQKCEFQNNVKNTCPAGEIVEGVRSDGSVHCRSATAGFDANGVDTSAPAESCPDGTRPNLIWNNTLKRMSVNCI